MKTWHLIIIILIIVGAIFGFYYYSKKQKMKKIASGGRPKTADGTEGWLRANYEVLVKFGDLKKETKFQDSIANFLSAIEKVKGSEEAKAYGYDPSSFDWLKVIWTGYASGRFASMDEAIKANVAAA